MSKDVRLLDCIEGLCLFCEDFELKFNNPDYDFLKFRMGENMLAEEVRELNKAIEEKNDIEIVDGACDVAFIALVQAYIVFRKYGSDPINATGKVRAAMMEVCKSNLKKNPPEEAGKKITKPDGWAPPRIEDLFRHLGGGLLSKEVLEREAKEKTNG